MPPNFYSNCNLVDEKIVPPDSSVITLSGAPKAHSSVNPVCICPYKPSELIGENILIDGISIRSPLYLTHFFYKVRGSFNKALETGCNAIDITSRKYYTHERKVTTTISNLHSDRNEDLLPGFTYITIAAMSGSVLTRNKYMVLRLITPLLFGACCFSYVLPTTFKNTGNLLYNLEKNALPEFTTKQDYITDSSKKAIQTTIEITSSSIVSIRTAYNEFITALKKLSGINL